jgi:17beta-estradiol 17-dehydrogenase / very-long-chain 3-oxoacyl-CoA reductase
LTSRYGEGSWAVVTGASDGIGKGFVVELAKLKFNVILIARSVDKMEAICKEVQENYQVQTKIIKADYTEGDKVEFYTKLRQELEGYDISILVNNVGIGNTKALIEYFDDIF